MGRLHVYEKRAGKYVSYFKHYVNSATIVVEVGCGVGVLSKVLAYGKRPVIAIDIERKLLKEIKKPYIERICADAHNLSLKEGSVDCVLSPTSRVS